MKTRKTWTRTKRTVNTSHRSAGVAAVISLALFASSALALRGPRKEQQPVGVIFGTVYGPDDRPVYGVKIQIHPVGKNKPNWELMSDHRGEFAQRVPLDPAGYEVSGEAEIVPIVDGKPQHSHK